MSVMDAEENCGCGHPWEKHIFDKMGCTEKMPDGWTCECVRGWVGP